MLPGAVFDSGTGGFSGTAGVKSGVGSSMVKVGLIFSTGFRRGVSKLVSGVWGGSLWTDWTSRLGIEPGGSGSGCGSGNSSSWTGLGSDDFLCLESNKELLLWPRRWSRARGDESADELEEVVVVVVVVVAVEDRRKSGLKRALKSAIMLCFCETFSMAVEGQGGREGGGLESCCHRGILLLFPVDCITLLLLLRGVHARGRIRGRLPETFPQVGRRSESIIIMLEGQSELGGGRQTTSTSTKMKMKMSRYYSLR